VKPKTGGMTGENGKEQWKKERVAESLRRGKKEEKGEERKGLKI
jgi:hypothetical protein